MPIDVRRILEILQEERDGFGSLSLSFRGWLGYKTRVFNDELRAAGRENLVGQSVELLAPALGGELRNLADQLSLIREHYAEMQALADYFLPRPDTANELVVRAVDLKDDELIFLSQAQRAMATIRPEWAERVGLLIEKVVAWRATIEGMFTIFRVHMAHMWYRKYQARSTPDPFAMVSVYTYTRNPEAWPRGLFRQALSYLENDPEAFPTFGFAQSSTSLSGKRRGHQGGGAFYEVIGIEVEEVDQDELGDYLEDELRYYVAFYKTQGGVPNIYREYYGRLELSETGWIIFAQDKNPPLWKAPEKLGFPEVLKP